MKKGIHPKWNKNVPVVVNGKTVMEVGSTLDEIRVEIWSGNHPFYTGKEMLVDTDNLVDKFNKKKEAAQKTPVLDSRAKREKRTKAKAARAGGPLTLKDMLKQM